MYYVKALFFKAELIILENGLGKKGDIFYMKGFSKFFCEYHLKYNSNPSYNMFFDDEEV